MTPLCQPQLVAFVVVGFAVAACTARPPTRQGRCAPLWGRLRRSWTRGPLPVLGSAKSRAGRCPARWEAATAVLGSRWVAAQAAVWCLASSAALPCRTGS